MAEASLGPGAVLIALVRPSIQTLLLDQNYDWIIVRCAIIIAVVLDQGRAQLNARRPAWRLDAHLLDRQGLPRR